MPFAPVLVSGQSATSSQEELPLHATSTIQVPSAAHQAQHRFHSPRHSSSTMNRPPILPLANDRRESFVSVKALHSVGDDDSASGLFPGPHPNTVLGGVLTAEPVGEIAGQDSECSSMLSQDGVYIAAAPVSYISNFRYKRREALDYEKIISYDRVGPRNSRVPKRELPPDCKWVSHVHPEGSVYFQQENWFTNVWLYDDQNLRDIDAALDLVRGKFRQLHLSPSRYEICLDIDTEEDEETKKPVKLGCYYIWDRDTEEVFWLQGTESSFFYDGVGVKILGREHLRHAGGIGYWSHVYMFPHGRDLNIEQLHELRADITYYMFDKQTSKSSTAPYNKDDLNNLLDILKEIEATLSKEVKKITRPQHIVVVSRLKETLCRERFMHFHGERYAQLDSDRSVYENTHRERSIIFNILTWMFFFTPPIYFEQLSRIWVDKKINYDRWRSFIGDLQDDWVASITPSTVILSANVGFLAIQSIDEPNGSPTRDRSMGQTVSYMSTLFSISNILACTILAWQHRRSEHRYAEDAVSYLVPRASSRWGIEKLAIIFSIPTTLFLFAVLTFFIAITWEAFHAANTSTRVIAAIAMSIIAVLLFAIIHNREWSDQNANSLAGNMARMQKLVNAARKRSIERWAGISGTLVALPISWLGRKSTKQSLRSSRAGMRTSMEMSRVSLSTDHAPQRGEVADRSPASPPGLPDFEDMPL
ncbi:hypothetical protein GSI_14779 [Ganoderma sinense ZZ0214-1]|uniref:Uncharacterized protein n=1 Tax=Ganoderma sinense ZZ0214-1 TaxID=1077348 RepID=A0A2G8RQ48_9APHY|nr:hypothetical protein GSI_14779 [Ganoderma sinense ZZ0214-1]